MKRGRFKLSQGPRLDLSAEEMIARMCPWKKTGLRVAIGVSKKDDFGHKLSGL